MEKLALLNMNPYYNNASSDTSKEQAPGLTLDLSSLIPHKTAKETAVVKRMTAPKVNEKDTDMVTWAGQSFTQGKAQGEARTEKLAKDHTITVRDSEAVLVFFNPDDVYK